MPVCMLLDLFFHDSFPVELESPATAAACVASCLAFHFSVHVNMLEQPHCGRESPSAAVLHLQTQSLACVRLSMQK